jgi:hypothetical protein
MRTPWELDGNTTKNPYPTSNPKEKRIGPS